MKRRACVRLLAALLAGTAVSAGAATLRSGAPWCGTSATAARDAVWAHREAMARSGLRGQASSARSLDVGQIAVLQDEGDLAFVRNPLDLQSAGLEFTQDGAGYRVSRVDRALSPEPGTALTLSDDDFRSVRLPFAFPFYGRTYSEAFVASDGNITFEQGDRASTDRNVGRLVSGPPRIAPLLADLDPSAGGSVTTRDGGDRYTVTWTEVPQFEQHDKNTFQVTLHSSGRIEFVYGAQLSAEIEQAVVGLAPGKEQGGLTRVDFSSAAGSSGAGALAESFQRSDSLDTVAVAKKFYRSHGDEFQQIVIFTSRRLTGGRTFAFEQTVKNSDGGIGFEPSNFTAEYGSAGRLESIVMMDSIEKYPDDLNRPVAGEESTLSVLGQEVGHRWLTKALFRDGSTNSNELLGRDDVHWSFFLDSDGSHLEGNDIEDQGGGRFKTVGAGQRYSPLDQYLMGLRPPEDVPPFFLVRGATGVGERDREPTTGLTFDGTRKDLTINDVIASLGQRNPPAGPRPAFREVFVYVAVDGPANSSHISRIDRIRTEWESFFARSTDGRGTVDTRLNQ